MLSTKLQHALEAYQACPGAASKEVLQNVFDAEKVRKVLNGN